MDRGAWEAAVHGATKSWKRLNNFTFTFHFHALEKEMATHSSVLAWRIPGTGEPGGLPSVGSQSQTRLKRLSSSGMCALNSCMHCALYKNTRFKGVPFRSWSRGKDFACQCRRHKRHGFDPWVGKIPWRRKLQPTLVFLLGKSHGQRSLVGYSPWACKELDTTEQLSEHKLSLRQFSSPGIIEKKTPFLVLQRSSLDLWTSSCPGQPTFY